MLTTVLATKLGMTQAWTTTGKRVAVTRCQLDPMLVVGQQPSSDSKTAILEIGYGQKKLKNMSKPLRSRLEKSGFSNGVKEIRGMKFDAQEERNVLSVGSSVESTDFLSVGDVVKVQGVTKGRGFAGAMKRHGFQGSQRTHGQSDRARAVGSIGAGTNPGRVLKGKRMPGRMGTDTQTVTGLVVLYINPVTHEVWLSGPVPGFRTSTLVIRKTGDTKQIELDLNASGIKVPAAPEVEVTESEVETPAIEAPTTEVTTENTETETVEATNEA